MAASLIFRYRPGASVLHRTDTRAKLVGMIALSLTLIRVSPYKLILITPLLVSGLFLLRERKVKSTPPLFVLLMPLIIFSGNVLSLRFSAGESMATALTAGALRMGAFISILMLAQLFIATTDPPGITPALYAFLRTIPLLPARDLSMRMGLSLTLIPVILDEMNEIRDAMICRCGWHPARPLRNLFHMGLPLLEGILTRAGSLADAMESRCYNEEATIPELQEGSLVLLPLLVVTALTILLILPGFLPIKSHFFPYMFRYY